MTNLITNMADPRIHSEKIMDHLEIKLESFAQKITTSYSVSDRSNTLKFMDDVINQLDYYKGKVDLELNKAGFNPGHRFDTNLLIRFPE
jgi:hypothetical protein